MPLAVGTILIAGIAMPPVADAGQRGTSAGDAKPTQPPPRTHQGRPDLQGVWNFSTATPFERPAELQGKEFLEESEVARYEEQVVSTRSLDRRDGSRSADVGRAYNDFWADWGSRVVATKRTSLIVEPPDGKLPPLTPEAQKREAARLERARRPPAGPEDRSLSERCMLGFNAGPPIVTGPYNNQVQLFQTSGHFVIFNEMNHNARIVPLDGRPHVVPAVRQWSGDSRGRWEGDTLVIETRNFRDEGTGNITIRVANDANMQVTERFTLLDRDTLLYRATVTDPTTWTRPWTVELSMTRTADRIYEFACHEGNYGMTGMLEGARAEEMKTAGEAATQK
jgi:hypothetical protein